MLSKIKIQALISTNLKYCTSRQISNKVFKEQKTETPSRVLIKVPRNTGIEGFDKNIRAKDNEKHLKHVPSWVENCRGIEQHEINSLYEAFPAVVEDVVQMDCTKDMDIGQQQLRRLMEHIVPWLPTMAVQLIAADRFYLDRRREKGQKMPNKEEHQCLVHKLAWCTEMIMREIFMIDDLMDHCETRNRIKCWHAFPNVGLRACNDARALHNVACLVLHKYFSTMDYYTDLVQWTHEINFQIAVAEIELSAIKALPNQHISKEAYVASVDKLVEMKKKLGEIFFTYPAVNAMIMHGITDPLLKSQAIELGNDVANYAGMVDDWVDSFGDIRVNERETTDIQEGKPSLAIWKAIELGNQNQSQILLDCYGKKDESSIAAVLEIFHHLNVREAVKELCEETRLQIEKKIGLLSHEDLPCSIWLDHVNHYKDVLCGIAARV